MIALRWKVIRVDATTATRHVLNPAYPERGAPMKAVIEVQPAGEVVGEHNQRATAEKHAAKNRRMTPTIRYAVEYRGG